MRTVVILMLAAAGAAAQTADIASNGQRGTRPDASALLRAYDLFRAAAGQPEEQRLRTAQEI